MTRSRGARKLNFWKRRFQNAMVLKDLRKDFGSFPSETCAKPIVLRRAIWCALDPAMEQAPSDNMAPDATDPYARAVTGLLAALENGTLHPGDPLPVPRFADALRLSATPVREALAHLSGAGLLTRHHRHGYSVPVLTASDLIDLFALDAALLFGTAPDNPIACALLKMIDIRLAPLKTLLKARGETEDFDRLIEMPADWSILAARRDRLSARAEPFARALREAGPRSEL